MPIKVAFMQLSSCWGCHQSLLNAHLGLLPILPQLDIVYWPAVVDFKLDSLIERPDKDILVGFIEGVAIPPVAVFLDGYLRHPYRIMGKKDLKIAVFIGESAVSPEAAYFISNAIMSWAEGHGAKEIITLDGFGYLNRKDEGKVYMVSEPEIKNKAEKLKIPPLKSGFIKGFAGAILNKTMISDIDGYAFLVGTRPELPDPGGAASLVKIINDLKELDINVETLIEQSESIKKKLSELALQTNEMSAGTPRQARKKSNFYT